MPYDIAFRIIVSLFGVIGTALFAVPAAVILSLSLFFLNGTNPVHSIKRIVRDNDLDSFWDPEKILNYIKYGNFDK